MLKHLSKGIFLLLIITALCLNESYAYMVQYPPFPFGSKDLPPHLQAEDLTELEWGPTIQLDDLKVELFRTDAGYQLLKIKDGERTVFETEEGTPIVFDVYYVDLDSNKWKDFLIFSNYSGCGLAAYNDRVDILLRIGKQAFSHIHYNTKSASLEDFVDMNRDGIYEIIYTDFYSGKKHNYFVYSIYEIKEAELHNANKKHSPSFPKFIWFTHKPNDKQSTRITIEEKEEYLKRLPEVIKNAR